MKNLDDHSNEEAWEAQQKALFEQVEAPFKKSKEDIWTILSNELEEPTEVKTMPTKVIANDNKIKSIWPRLVAAAVIFGICTTSFCKFYTTNIDCARGAHLAHSLPDGSTIQMNAESSITYAPYWWHFDRTVQLEGEAFFEVEKGSRFVVTSTLGTTEVLGTSFNIYTRNKEYQVLCTTGKVQVTANSSQHTVTLAPNEFATLVDLKIVEKHRTSEAQNIISWKKNNFYFNEVPLKIVFEEIERQYNASIDYSIMPSKDHVSISSFEKHANIETALEMVCLPFDLTFKKIKNNVYKIEAK